MIAQYSYTQVITLMQLITFTAAVAAAALFIGASALHAHKTNKGRSALVLWVLAAVAGCIFAGGMFCITDMQKLQVLTPVDTAAFAAGYDPWVKGTDGTQLLLYVNWPKIGETASALGTVLGIDLAALLLLLLIAIPVKRSKSAGAKVILASLFSIVIGLIVGSIITLISGLSSGNITPKNTSEAVQLIYAGLFSTGRDAAGNLTFGFNAASFGNMLFRATPLILTGLSVALANKTGLFNIGAPGQYLMGTAASLFIALYMPTTAEWGEVVGVTGAVFPAWLVWALAFLGGMLAGALWGAIPGILKAALNINEVLACIMTNWIAANVVTYAFDLSQLKNVIESTKTSYIYKTSFNGVETSKLGLDQLLPGSQVNGGFVIAVVMAVLVLVILNKTTFGFELKACGSNRFAARYAGIRDKRGIVVSMAIAGSLAGAAGALYQLSGNTEFFWQTYQTLPAVGFNGIPVALLAANNPLGVVFSGLFMSMLEICGVQLRYLTGFNEYITQVIVAVIVYLSAFAMIFRMLLSSAPKKNGKEAAKK